MLVGLNLKVKTPDRRTRHGHTEISCVAEATGSVKWSNPPGHLAKVVILPTEVKDDDREKAAEIHA